MDSALGINVGWLNNLPGHQSTDVEFLAYCDGQTMRNGVHCGFYFDGINNALYPGWGGITSLGTSGLPWGDAWVNRLAMPTTRCPSGGECIRVLAGGVPGYVRVER